jgi:hypothetical protein
MSRNFKKLFTIFAIFSIINASTIAPNNIYKIKAKSSTGSGPTAVSYCLEVKKSNALTLKPCQLYNKDQTFQVIESGVSGKFSILKGNADHRALAASTDNSGQVTSNRRPKSFTTSTGSKECSLCPTSSIIRVESSTLNYADNGWGGWSCPANTKMVRGGINPPPGSTLLPTAVSQAAQPGVGTYPVYPHYTFPSGETGWVVQNGGTSQSLNIWVECQFPSPRIYSSELKYSETGWGGWSCPSGTEIVNGGVEALAGNSLLPMAVSQAAKPGVGTYPTYSHYTFKPPETGWVAQNGGTNQDVKIYVECQIPRTSCYLYTFVADNAYYKIKSEWAGVSSNTYLKGLKSEADLLATATTPYPVTWTSTSTGDEILWEFEVLV